MGIIYTATYFHDKENFSNDDSVVYNIEIYAIIFYNLVLGIAFSITGVLRIGKIYYSGERQRKEIIIVCIFPFDFFFSVFL